MKKFYSLSAEAHAACAGSKMPLQQAQLLKAMALAQRPMTGVDIVKYAVEHCGLATRQRYEVLYAWYARGNEKFGAVMTTEEPKPQIPEPVQQVEETDISDVVAEAQSDKRGRKSHAA